jgi:hypothetical protein
MCDCVLLVMRLTKIIRSKAVLLQGASRNALTSS